MSILWDTIDITISLATKGIPPPPLRGVPDVIPDVIGTRGTGGMTHNGAGENVMSIRARSSITYPDIDDYGSLCRIPIQVKHHKLLRDATSVTMKSELNRKASHVCLFIVLLATALYFCIFSFLSIRRLHVLSASYFDLGIMHQTVHNTYMGIRQVDPSRFLELTDPHGSGRQVSRISIHNDILLAVIAPLYFIYDGPETLLVLQTGILASGAIALYLITRFKTCLWHQDKKQLSSLLSVLIPILYLLYAPLHRSNLYEFHAVTLSTGLILWMYYAYLRKKWKTFGLLFILILLSKEQTGFSLGIFLLVEAIARIVSVYMNHKPLQPQIFQLIRQVFQDDRRFRISVIIAFVSILYVFVSVFVLMPAFRSGSNHFALGYFDKDSSKDGPIMIQYVTRLFDMKTVKYLIVVYGPSAFLAICPPFFIPAIPDLLINLLSINPFMRGFYFHYTAMITPWVFLGLVDSLMKIAQSRLRRLCVYIVLIVITISSLHISSLESPLPYSKTNQNWLWSSIAKEEKDILLWQQILKRDEIKVSSTGQFAPYLSGRRIFYDFSKLYTKADYIVLMVNQVSGTVMSYGDTAKLKKAYGNLLTDTNFKQIYKNGAVEVYKKL